jgi:predicted  nucleic acid-binding Zn-ribbon protein
MSKTDELVRLRAEMDGWKDAKNSVKKLIKKLEKHIEILEKEIEAKQMELPL